MSKRSRRQFLEDSMLAAAAAAAAARGGPAAFAALPKGAGDANNKLALALVGAGGRSREHVKMFGGRPDVEFTYVVDPDPKNGNQRADDIAKLQQRRPKVVQDLRRAYQDKSVDLVSIATPNHWHALAAIWAIQHGKDVYCEKPVSHNVSEGRRIVEAARKHNKICQTGTQSRSMPGMREAIQYVHDGKIGKLSVARGLCYKRRESIGPRANYPIPKGVDYNLWLGPAPEAPLTRRKFHYDWHWQWPYGNGDLGNQGIHQMDLARWGLGVGQLSNSVLSYGGRFGYRDAGETANTQVVIHDYGDRTMVFEVRGLETKPYKGASVGVIFEGTDGYVAMASYSAGIAFDRDGNKVREFNGLDERAHYDNFLSAVRSRKHEQLNADILEGHLSSALCHLGNISYLLGKATSVAQSREQLDEVKSHDNKLDTFNRTMEHLSQDEVDLAQLQIRFGAPLTIDPGAENFVDNEAANRMLTREYRDPFIVPNTNQI